MERNDTDKESNILAIGRVAELWSKNGENNQTLFTAIATAQKGRGSVLYIDLLNSIDMHIAKKYGVDEDKFYLTNPLGGSLVQFVKDVIEGNPDIAAVVIKSTEMFVEQEKRVSGLEYNEVIEELRNALKTKNGSKVAILLVTSNLPQ